MTEVYARYQPCGHVEHFLDPALDGEFQFPMTCPDCDGVVESVRDA